MKTSLEALRVKEETVVKNNYMTATRFTFEADCILLQDSDYLQITQHVKNNLIDIENDFLYQLKLESKQKLDSINSKLENSNFTNSECSQYLAFNKHEIYELHKKLKINSIEEYVGLYTKESISSLYSLGENSLPLKIMYAKALSYENLSENAVYYRIVNMIFNKYKHDYAKENFDYRTLMVSDELKQGIETIHGEGVLCRYNLFKLDHNNHKLTNNILTYIYDHSNTGTYLIINDKIKRLVDAFNDLIDNGYVNDLSVKVESIRDNLPLLEEKMYGEKFKFKLTELPELSRFYDLNNPDDSVWVFVSNKEHKFSITFEETLEDTFYDKDFNVITNLVHLEITKDNDQNFISHIDHEYIIYDIETYFERLKSPTQKGGHKIKTFKIDNAKIPLNYEYQGINILFLIITECVGKKELVNEYFENI
ncbi:hypothetical protein VCR15J2_470042 [Vibrio coralliirubri]|uniref:hypothetical protein n=1 Tax=Vibrio coralliirubri TaxID=1516159 RepID=UPI000637EAFC|nr:hypothetical protein [Vibrio coralliirubri]CDT62475.1 hypothetical protein VCR15J2_470042 [Vibrio coralliirubri]